MAHSAPPPTAVVFDPFQSAYLYARRFGFSPDDAVDCAADFRSRLWSEARLKTLSGSCEVKTLRCLRRYAKNHAIDALRHSLYVQQYECPFPDNEDYWGEALPDHYMSGMHNQAERMLHSEFWQCVQKVVALLRPAQQELFHRRYVLGEAIQDIAQATGRTPHALEESLSHLRHRLRDLMLQQGLDEQEMRAYF